ncbi:mitochondrial import protein Pam17 [Obba rivulosa]|uniref:Presequence translocated-associated motor subunit PAM17 n=1 Tax=Obba rivulosa TaxID=1052685 RepID=A0A8E2B190_9APHY|nr:mitochondrial import protein Pam17 [Obba rivulosa]
MSAWVACRPLPRSLQLSSRLRVTLTFSRPNPSVFTSSRAHLSTTARRHAANPGTTATAKRETVSKLEQEALPWAQYLAIRKAKRRWETAMTIPFTIGGFVGGIIYFGRLEMDPTKPIFNIDPMYVYGFATLACAGLGYLIGPVVGSAIWRMTHRRLMNLIEKRDREFYNHIVKNRGDPAAQSATNPVPDYYGEKIGSIHDYRQWLRDQAKFKRKAYLPED